MRLPPNKEPATLQRLLEGTPETKPVPDVRVAHWGPTFDYPRVETTPDHLLNVPVDHIVGRWLHQNLVDAGLVGFRMAKKGVDSKDGIANASFELLVESPTGEQTFLVTASYTDKDGPTLLSIKQGEAAFEGFEALVKQASISDPRGKRLYVYHPSTREALTVVESPTPQQRVEVEKTFTIHATAKGDLVQYESFEDLVTLHDALGEPCEEFSKLVKEVRAAIKVAEEERVEAALAACPDIVAKHAKPTDKQRACMSRNISKKVKEGWDQDKAVAASYNICGVPELKKAELSKEESPPVTAKSVPSKKPAIPSKRVAKTSTRQKKVVSRVKKEDSPKKEAQAKGQSFEFSATGGTYRVVVQQADNTKDNWVIVESNHPQLPQGVIRNPNELFQVVRSFDEPGAYQFGVYVQPNSDFAKKDTTGAPQPPVTRVQQPQKDLPGSENIQKPGVQPQKPGLSKTAIETLWESGEISDREAQIALELVPDHPINVPFGAGFYVESAIRAAKDGKVHTAKEGIEDLIKVHKKLYVMPEALIEEIKRVAREHYRIDV